MIRARIRLDTNKDVSMFVHEMNSTGLLDRFVIEDADNSVRVSAHSYLGVIYASAEFGDYMYIVNETNDGYFPSFVDNYRHPGEDSISVHD